MKQSYSHVAGGKQIGIIWQILSCQGYFPTTCIYPSHSNITSETLPKETVPDTRRATCLQTFTTASLIKVRFVTHRGRVKYITNIHLVEYYPTTKTDGESMENRGCIYTGRLCCGVLNDMLFSWRPMGAAVAPGFLSRRAFGTQSVGSGEATGFSRNLVCKEIALFFNLKMLLLTCYIWLGKHPI